MKYAPICLFVYKRLWHTTQTVEALQKNVLAKQSDLIVYSDGSRTASDKQSVKDVRDYIRTIVGFHSVKVICKKKNHGLSKSIIYGVTETVNKYGNVIVLEDDLVTSPHFLKFMNDGLNLYRRNRKVISVHGFLDPKLEGIEKKPFFLRGADCWGWATWKRGWLLFEPNGKKLLRKLQINRLCNRFDYYGGQKNIQMLKNQINGKIDSWAIRWHASVFLHAGLTLYPPFSLVRNIGNDSSGTHKSSDAEIQYQKIYSKNILIESTNTIESELMLNKIQDIFSINSMKIMVKIIAKVITRVNIYFFRNVLVKIFYLYRKLRFVLSNELFYAPIANFVNIGGWLKNNEAKALYKLILNLQHKNLKVVELGSWVGKSSFVLAKAIRQLNANGRVYCVDPFNGSGDELSINVYNNDRKLFIKRYLMDLKELFIYNMTNNGVMNYIDIKATYSYEARKNFTAKIDFLFLDANHEYKAALKDYKDWMPLIKRGGYIAFHDVDFDPWRRMKGKGIHQGPGLVVQRHIIHNPLWGDFNHIDSLFIAKKL